MNTKAILIIFFIISIMQINACKQAPQTTGIFDQQNNIGSPSLNGFAHYDAGTDRYHLSGAGKNIWDQEDEFFFLSKEIDGDFILRASLKFEGDGVNPHRKIGIMLRESLTAGSAHINGVLHGDGLTSLQYRSTDGATTEELKAPVMHPDLIQLQRRGNTIILSAAARGETFTSIQIDDLELNNTAQLGIFICSHEADVVEEAVFSELRLIFPADEDFVPYRDYIGSQIEIMDVESGQRSIVHQSPLSLQAPNWSPDGKQLLFNSEGKIYAFDLANKAVNEINTGFAINNNNDHVLSFDGKTLGISDHTKHPDGQSLIYILPAEGGEPQLMTSEGPSYLHGFSPDGKFIAYTAGRDNASHLDIYVRPVDGSEEIRITNAPGLDDGSEYSPDGKYIYFNSSRTGTMQIWRMLPDGSEQTQLSFDPYNDWFPHVSPDGRWLVFISYEPEIAADDHPFYKNVYLRLMPAQGGEPRVIAYVYGGQGSMNVFNWSPDGKQIAFVSNTKMKNKQKNTDHD
ncbi:TolB family protein [Roseimarinus sediminis]|uniref:TolB family protein n=1 Tax=Roseimarinus sediminis TaxID=1610899 RepID=UPI003D1C202B